MTAQQAYNKRMEARKNKAKNLRQTMNALARSLQIVKEEKPTAKRRSWGFFVSPTLKTPKRTSQLVF